MNNSIPDMGKTFFSSLKHPDGMCRPRSLLLSSKGASLHGLKRSGLAGNRSVPSSAEVKNEMSSKSVVLVCFHGVHRKELASP
jgi:hypothetical protein